MGELGYLENPAHELGMLRAQAFRAMRVVVDIGVHVGLKIPANEGYHPAETWSPQLMLPFALEHGHEPEDFLRSEVDRYLGWPGQAIWYKVGELDLTEEGIQVGGGERLPNLGGLRRSCPLDRHLEG